MSYSERHDYNIDVPFVGSNQNRLEIYEYVDIKYNTPCTRLLQMLHGVKFWPIFDFGQINRKYRSFHYKPQRIGAVSDFILHLLAGLGSREISHTFDSA